MFSTVYQQVSANDVSTGSEDDGMHSYSENSHDDESFDDEDGSNDSNDIEMTEAMSRRQQRLRDNASSSRDDTSLDADNETNVPRRQVRIPRIVEDMILQDAFVRWEEPWLLSVGTAIFFIVPTLLAYMFTVVFEWTGGRWWAGFIFLLHLLILLVNARGLVRANQDSTNKSASHRRMEESAELQRRSCFCCCSGQSRLFSSFSSLLDIIMLGLVYPKVMDLVIDALFTDIDGTIVWEWQGAVTRLHILKWMGYTAVLSRCTVGSLTLLVRYIKWKYPENFQHWRPTYSNFPINWASNNSPSTTSPGPSLLSLTRSMVPSTTVEGLVSDVPEEWLERRAKTGRCMSYFLIIITLTYIWSLLSAISHFGPWPTNLRLNPKHHTASTDHCDPLDETECMLPFPSFHHTRKDFATKSGWRVNLQANSLPPLRGGWKLHVDFLNEYDGFSTMGPIMFYLEGLKEAHEKRKETNSDFELQSTNYLEQSTTKASITLLLDVDSQELVPHSAEIDYLDPDRPMVLVFPASPLKHNNHYALTVVHATNKDGDRLPVTPGMQQLWKDADSPRRERLLTKVLPALEAAAPWINFQRDPEEIQLMFDFPTVSADSQLGMIRTVRDRMVQEVESPSWKWDEHVQVVSIKDYECSDDGSGSNIPARVIHAELEVPWFLDHPHSRNAHLIKKDDILHKPISSSQIGIAKFVVVVPCSLSRTNMPEASSNKKLQAIVEYGHGLFFNRQEVADGFLTQMAHDNGYLFIAMDWRGMSSFDLPVVIKMLIGKPGAFEAIRDNIIQGYANKYALQHFSRNGLLDMAELQFQGKPIPTLNDQTPTSIFYGISQGGILGAGYTALSGPTNLIDRAVLGVPGVSFAFIMTRSLNFPTYDTLLLLNFYNNRHVRMVLALCQMAWDTAEGAGVLAKPVTEPFPRMLLQAGLGDVQVPTISAEALARGLQARTLPNNPREIFGIPVSEASNSTWSGPDVTFTELLFEEQYASLPVDDVRIESSNSVHYCVRLDAKMQEQVVEFINSGQVIDPCVEDQCRRDTDECW